MPDFQGMLDKTRWLKIRILFAKTILPYYFVLENLVHTRQCGIFDGPGFFTISAGDTGSIDKLCDPPVFSL
jgi:hypothetical protein